MRVKLRLIRYGIDSLQTGIYLLNSPTEIQYESNLTAFRVNICALRQKLWSILKVYGFDIKKRLFPVGPNKYMHLGNASTSRVEGSYAYDKEIYW